MRLLPLLLVLGAHPAGAAVLAVGAGQAHPTLSAAVRAAADGDTIRLPAGTFYECASITRRDLIIEGQGANTVLTDTTCQGKAILVVQADGVTLRNLVLARARVPDRNGAGVRLEGQNLVLDRVRFDNDEVGLLAGAAGSGTVTVRDCEFVGGGVAGERPTAALLVGGVSRLLVEGSRFERFRGTLVQSSAVRTELNGNTFTTGGDPGEGGPVQAGGVLLMRDNTFRLGPHAPPRDAAVVATGDAAVLRGNRLENTTGQPMTLLLDWTGSDPLLEANVLGAGDAPVSSRGSLRHRAGGLARSAKDELRGAAGGAKRAVMGLFGR